MAYWQGSRQRYAASLPDLHTESVGMCLKLERGDDRCTDGTMYHLQPGPNTSPPFALQVSDSKVWWGVTPKPLTDATSVLSLNIQKLGASTEEAL